MSWTQTLGVRVQEAEIVVAVEGDDARSWLNGQMSNDLKRLTAERGVYGLVLTSKGRVLADVLAFERHGALFVSVDRGVWPTLREHFEKYIIMEDVTLRETSLVTVSLLGEKAEEIDPAVALAGLDATITRQTRLGPSVDVVVERASLDACRARLLELACGVGGGTVDDAAWHLARVEAGVPALNADFGEKTYPQEAGLKKRALAFDKGCYHGQEVVCMLESRGQVSRSLVRLALGERAEVGTPLRRDGEIVGELTSVAGSVALGFVKRQLALAGATLDAEHGAATVLGPVGA